MWNPFQAVSNYFARKQAQQADASATKEPRPLTTQLRFSERETMALISRIQEQWRGSMDDHERLKLKWADQEDAWRNKVGLAGGEEGQSNFRVPLILALCLAKHAREVEAVFGAKASVNAIPRGKMDAKQAKRVGMALDWQFFENMDGLKPLALCLLRRLKHGRSFALVQHETKFYTRTVLDEATGERISKRVAYKSGPVIYPLHNDDIYLPASLDGRTNFDSVQNAEFVGRQYWDTPTNMLRLEAEPNGDANLEGDYYQGIHKNWQMLVRGSRDPLRRDEEGDEIRIVSDEHEGVYRDSGRSAQTEQVRVLEWHMKWRRWVIAEDDYGDDEMGDESGEGQPVRSSPISDMENENAADSETGQNSGEVFAESLPSVTAGNQERIGGNSTREQRPDFRQVKEGQEYLDAGAEGEELAMSGHDMYSDQPFADDTFIDTDGIRKEMLESDLIVRYCPELNIIVGIQDASEVYPDTPNKRPVVSFSLLNDGIWWGMSLIELAEEIEKEMTVAANKLIDATLMSIGPPVFAEPAAGKNIANNKYEPFDIIWVTNAKSVTQMQINPNLQGFSQLWLMFQSIYEQLTGISNWTMGRAMDQPNAPRTLGGQRLVMGAGDTRLALDMRMLAQDLKALLDWVWDLWRMFGSEEEFFRVAEGKSQGLFEHGEVEGGFAKLSPKERDGDYDFSFEFADDLSVREAKKQDMLNLVNVISRFPRVMQDMQFQHRLIHKLCEMFGVDANELGDEPEAPFMPRTPETEWTMMLQGEDVHVHPQDDDDAHIEDHEGRVLAMGQGRPEDQDLDAMWRAQEHIEAHRQAQITKQQTQEIMAGVGAMLAASQGAGGQMQPNDPMTAVLQSLGGQVGAGNGMPPAQL